VKEKKIIESVLVRYGLVHRITSREKGRIYLSGRKGLVKILSGKGRDRFRIKAVLKFYYMLKHLGFSLTPVSALRFAQGMGALAFVFIMVFSFALYRNYGHDSTVAERTAGEQVRLVSQSGTLSRAADKSGSLFHDKYIREKEKFLTGSGSCAVMSIPKGAVLIAGPETLFSLDKYSVNETSIYIERGFLFSRVRNPYGAVYSVKTSSVIATVKGTSFAVTAGKGASLVEVLKGTVTAADKETGTVHEVQAGFCFSNGKVLPLSEKRLQVLRKLDSTDSGDPSSASGVVKYFGSASGGSGFKEALEKYGRVDEITLYSGRRYRGVILSRGENYRVMTARGIVHIPAREIKNTVTRKK